MKRMLSILIIFLLIGTVNIESVGIEISNNELKMENIKGKILRQGNNTPENNNFILNNLTITHKNGIVKGKGSLLQGEIEIPLVLNGKLYPVKGKSYYSDNLILGDIESTDIYNILEFKIENKSKNLIYTKDYNEEKIVLSIILEDKKTGQWINFQKDIDIQTFEELYKSSNMFIENIDMDKKEIEEKIISLLNIHNKADYGEQIQNSIKIEEKGVADATGKLSVHTPIETQSWSNISVNFQELNRLFNDLKNPNTEHVNLSNYNLPESLFKGSGWKKNTNFNTSPGWNYYAHSTEQIDYTITQITTFQHNLGFIDISGRNAKFDIALRYKDGMILIYDHHTKDLSVFYYNFGLTLQNLQIAQGELKDKNVYIAQTLFGKNLTKRGNSLIKYFVALIPHGDKVTNLWESLTLSTNEALGQRERFIGNNFEEQKNIHNGKVYRSISGTLNEWDFKKEGANTNLLGEIHIGSDIHSLGWGIKTTVGSNL